ncbi:hypothetical protein GYMLUDRAFT_39922 [Collybiopsis luxurians FD-317 M1]|nr:hypothetical protein GYMLUDRAFT_39922 [Collybiopsis luxurians FD-317 M1]
MSFNLYQKQHNLEPVLNNTWYDDEGYTVYTCHTPFRVSPHRTTTISKSVREVNNDDTGNDQNSETPSVDRTNIIYLAQIDWNIIKSSKMRFGSGRFSGREIEAKEYIKKEGWSLYGRNCTFTGEDGKKYKWRIVGLNPELILNDTSETPVALFHRETLSTKSSHLEVFPTGQHMVDEIFVTFIYIEQLRRAQGQS